MLLLPLLFALILTCLLLIEIEQDWQRGVLSAAIIWGIAIVFIAEGLGLFGQLSRSSVAFAWTLLDIIVVSILLVRNQNGRFLRLLPQLAIQLKTQLELFSTFGIINRLLLCLILTVIVLTGITALTAPPNNWDSMTYHMSRVMHWLQNGRLDHYPTYYTPQLYHPPWAELAIAHFQVLSRGDRWANCIQWLTLIGSTVGVSAITRELGASIRGQLFAAVFASTLPMGLLQATTTQNDYAVCFWLVCFVHCILQIHRDRPTIPLTLKLASSFGLALLTKTSAYIFSIPFLVWISISIIRKMGWATYKLAFIFISSVLAINAGHFLRNWQMFGSPITGGPEDLAVQYRMQYRSLATLLSNLVRNAAFHLSTPSIWFNAKLNGAITRFHNFIGIDPSDPSTTYPGAKFGVFQVSFNEDLAGNTVHFFTLVATIGCFLSKSKLRQNFLVWTYLLCVTGASVIFCWLLKWQPFNSRHHLTLFVLMAPVVGWVLSNLRWHRWIESFILIVAISTLPWIFNAEFRPWFGENSIFTMPRTEQYFAQRTWLKSPYLEAAQFFQTINCNEIGFFFANDPSGRVWEYPFWVLLDNQDGLSKGMKHLRSDNISNIKSTQALYQVYQPCAVIAVQKRSLRNSELSDVSLDTQDLLNIENHSYKRAWQAKPVYIYVPLE